MSCCDIQMINAVVGKENLIAGDHIQTSHALVTTGTVYSRGDLLVISATNVTTKATTPDTWDAICVNDMTAAQSTKHATDGVGMPVYNQGEYNILAVKINGVALTPAQHQAAIARGTKNKMELRIPV
jgi:hypothetical protein